MKIGTKEAAWVMVVLLVSKILFSDVNRFVYESGTAGYLQVLLCTGVALLLFWGVSALYKKSGAKGDLFDLAKSSMGKVGLIISGTILFAFELLNVAMQLKIFSNTISTITLTNSPIYFILIFITVVMVAAGYAGIEGISRFCSIGGFIMAVFLGILLLFDIPHCDGSNLFPILGNGALAILKGTRSIAVFNEIIFLFLLIPYLKPDISIQKIGFTSLIIAGVIFSLCTFFYILTVPYPVALNFYMPLLQISSAVNIDFLFERAESIYLLLWIITCFLYMGITFFFLLITFAKTFSLRNYKALIPAFMAILIVISGFWSNINQLRPFYLALYYIFCGVAYLLPAVIFTVSWIKNRKGQKKSHA